MDANTFFSALSVIIALTAALIATIPAVMNYMGWISIGKQKEEYQRAFDHTVEQLSSDKITAQLSAAVLLRRFYKVKFNIHRFIKKSKIEERDSYFLRNEAINVLASMLRTLPTGVYQKTLADGLSSCQDLSHADLQSVNLQNAYIGNDSYRINMSGVDFFCANLSKALVKKVDAVGCYFRDSILCDARFKDCNLSNSSFQGSDLTHTYFQNVILYGANFKNADNIPKEISEHIEDGICVCRDAITTSDLQPKHKIFFSMSGSLSHEDSHLTKVYEEYLNAKGYLVEKYSRDNYPQFGQLTAVKARIEKCDGMIVFGSNQILIKNGIFRPNLSDEKVWENEWLSTSWNEIEVGMGVMLGLPILLVQKKELRNGIFDSCLNEILIDRTLDRTDYNNLRDLNKNESFMNWLSKLPQS